MARSTATDYADKRRAILKTSADFFAETGYNRAAMSQLAVACGISKSSIYHYYTNKETLLFDILAKHLSELLEIVNAHNTERYDPPVKLRLLVGVLLTAYRGANAEHRLQLDAMRYLSSEKQDYLKDIQRQIVLVFSQTIRDIDPDLFANKSIDLRAVTMSLFGMLNWFYLWHQPEKGLSRDEYAELATDILLGGLSKLANSTNDS